MAPIDKKHRAKKKASQKHRRFLLLLLLLIVPLTAALILIGWPRSQAPVRGFTFQKQGELRFISQEDGRELAAIDIEIADDELTRQRGLMWRREMADKQGMFFIMEAQEPQSFWMLNTYLALDIIFVDEALRIVSIAAGAQPQSLDPVRSTQPAKYVVEVLAGFCRQHDIQPGDSIVYERI